jgi:hypothetical protein
MVVKGTRQLQGYVPNFIAGHAEDLTPPLGRLAASTSSRDFHQPGTARLL